MYKDFKKEMLRKSVSKDYKEAVKEWGFVRKQKRNNDTLLPCLCCRLLRNVSYYINFKNNNVIVAGSKCSGTFPRDVKTKADALYKKAFDRVFTTGIYVDTIGPDYDEKIKEALIACIREEMFLRPREMKDAVVNIISKSENADYLKPILEEIIAEEKKQRIEQEKAAEEERRIIQENMEAARKAEAVRRRLAEEISRAARETVRVEKEKLAKAEQDQKRREYTERALAMLPPLPPISERVNNLPKSTVNGDIRKFFGLKT